MTGLLSRVGACVVMSCLGSILGKEACLGSFLSSGGTQFVCGLFSTKVRAFEQQGDCPIWVSIIGREGRLAVFSRVVLLNLGPVFGKVSIALDF